MSSLIFDELIPRNYLKNEVDDLKKILEKTRTTSKKRNNSFYFVIEKLIFRLDNIKYVSDSDFFFLSETIHSFSELLEAYDDSYSVLSEKLMQKILFEELIKKLDQGLFFDKFVECFSYSFFSSFKIQRITNSTAKIVLEDLKEKNTKIPIDSFTRNHLTISKLLSLELVLKDVSYEVAKFINLFECGVVNEQDLFDFHDKLLLQIELIIFKFKSNTSLFSFVENKKEGDLFKYLQHYLDEVLELKSQKSVLFEKINKFNAIINKDDTSHRNITKKKERFSLKI